MARKVYGHERAALGRDAPLAITPEVGKLLYLLALARRPRLIVEFGTSLGVSTVYLAAAVRDLGAGSLITTELRPDKAARAAQNLTEAGLADLVEIRVGDALDVLHDLARPVEFLFLDGSNDLYIPVLDLLEPRMVRGAIVVADLSRDDPHVPRYCERVRDEASGYVSIGLPLDAGVEVALRLT